MGECSGNNSAAEKESSNIIPGCTNASSGEKGCTSAATTIDTTSTTSTSTAAKTDGHSAASIALAATAVSALVVPEKQAATAIGAADIVVDYVTPTITKFYELLGKVQTATDINYIETNLKLKQAFQKEANKNALDILLQKFIKENKGETNENILKEKLTKFNNALDNILNMGVSQSGGKKIILRTNKSIKQFLNPKITFTNMLKSNSKSKSKRKRITKTKSKKRRTNK